MDAQTRMQIKHDLIQTTASRGWNSVREIAETTVKQMERAAIDEDDDVKGNNLRRQAKAARQFVNDFFHQIDVMLNLDDEDQSKDEDLYTLAM